MSGMTMAMGRFADRDTVVFERFYAPSVDAVWSALIDPVQMSAWWLPCRQLEPRLGGRYTMGLPEREFEGRITEFEPPVAITFSKVTRFELTAVDGGCRMVLTVKRWPAGWNPVSLAGFHAWLDQLALRLKGTRREEWSIDVWPAVYPAYEYLIRHAAAGGNKAVHRAHFAESDATLSGEAMQILDTVIALLKAELALRLYLDSFGDDPGSQEDTMALSKKRVGEVVAYLEAGGIAAERIMQAWGGNAHMLVPSDSAAGRADNRRVELRPIY